jgi:hypothetical protein
VLLGCGVARGAALELLGPDGAVPPEGFSLALHRVGEGGRSSPLQQPKLEATGAELSSLTVEGPLRVVRVVPKPGAREVVVKASDGELSAEARYPLGPPAARVELTLDPPAPVKNRGEATAELRVRLLKPDGSADPDSAPPVLRANVGSLTGLEAVGPGEFRARYGLPRTRFPEVAVIAALSAWPHPQSIHGTFGSLRVPLASYIELPGKAEANASMSVELAGVVSSATAGPDGKFKIPLVVPPGFGFASATAVDRIGNRRTTQIPLNLPPTDQLACVINPARVPPGGMARVLCAVSDPYGKEVATATVQLKAGSGQLGAPRRLPGGISEWIYTAPRALLSAPDVLKATWAQGRAKGSEELKVEIQQGPATQVTVSAAESLVHRGGALALEASVTDGLGRPRAGAQLALAATEGKFAPVEGDGGVLRTRWEAPLNGSAAAAQLSVGAFGPVGSEPARLTGWLEGGELLAAVTDLAGLPVPRQPLRVNGAERTTGEDGIVGLGPAASAPRFSIVHREWQGLRLTLYALDGGGRLFPAGARPGTPPAQVSVTLAPPVPVNVRLRVEGARVTYWVESPSGELLKGRPVQVEVSGGSRGEVTESEGRSSFAVAGVARATVSVADVATGVTALAEVKP